MTQLDLFGPKAFRQLQAENDRLKERLEHAKVEFRKLRDELETVSSERYVLRSCAARYDGLKRERDAVQRQLDTVTAERDMWRRLTDLMATSRGTSRLGGPSQGAGWKDRDLKRLLGLVHPDRWSQGQPATELAHELAATINQMRKAVQA